MRPAIGTVISVLVISGCRGSLKGGAGGTGGIIERLCSPGVAFPCECAPGIEGLQICAADGNGFLGCVCGDPGTGGTTGTGGAGGVGGAGGTICDAPSLVFQSNDLQRGCGSEAGCHGAMLHESGLDLVSPGVIARLLDKAPDPVTSVSCMGSTMPYLISSSNPARGLLIDKLSSTPSCGSPQPFPLGGLPPNQQDCLMQWATAVTTGVITP